MTKITVEKNINASRQVVWNTYTNPEDIVHWNAASDDWHTTNARVDLRVGGAFSSRMEAKDGSFGFDFAGTYTKLIPHQCLEYTFGDRVAQVSFTDTPSGTNVKIVFDAESTHSIEQQQSGWQAILNHFACYVEAKR